MWSEKRIRGFVALTIIIILLLVAVQGLFPIASYLFGSLVLFVLSKPLFDRLRDYKIPKSISAVLVIIVTLIFIILPFVFIIGILTSEIQNILKQANLLNEVTTLLNQFLPEFDLTGDLSKQISDLTGIFSNVALTVTKSFNDLFIGFGIMYFTLYYLLTADQKKLKETVYALVPFNHDNTDKLMKEFRNLTYSIFISTVVMAGLQGIIVTIGLYLVGLENALIWGVVTSILALIPIVGPILILAPAAGITFLQENYVLAVGFGILSVIVLLTDNFLRPVIQNRLGNIHPLISLFGLLVGLPLFGAMGLIVGPLLLSYLISLVQMFIKEYVEPEKKTAEIPNLE
jgi:predicted PurR-regulated permease PerM